MVEPTPTANTDATLSRWWTTRSIVAHTALVIWIPGCAIAAWWQVGIAEGGDVLGWIYSVMWPCFAVFGIVFWWFLVHDDPDSLGARGLRRMREHPADASTPVSDGRDEVIVRAESEDPELAAYNAYLAQLANQPKSWRR
jgi:hypothetical protein